MLCISTDNLKFEWFGLIEKISKNLPRTKLLFCVSSNCLSTSDHPCIAWSGLSRTIPVLLFLPEAAVSKDGNICSVGGTLQFVDATK